MIGPKLKCPKPEPWICRTGSPSPEIWCQSRAPRTSMCSSAIVPPLVDQVRSEVYVRHPPSCVPGDDRHAGRDGSVAAPRGGVRGAGRRSRSSSSACPSSRRSSRRALGLSAFALGGPRGRAERRPLRGLRPRGAARGPAGRARSCSSPAVWACASSPSSPRPRPICPSSSRSSSPASSAAPRRPPAPAWSSPRSRASHAGCRWGSARPRSRSAGSPPPSRCRSSHRRGAGAGRWRPRRSSRSSARRSWRARGCPPRSAATRAGARTWRSSRGRPRSSTPGSGRSSSSAVSTRC